MTYNEKLRKLREVKGLNRVEVEKLSGISYSCIKDLENGTSNPTLFTIETLCDFYGVNIWDLLNPNLDLNPFEKNEPEEPIEVIKTNSHQTHQTVNQYAISFMQNGNNNTQIVHVNNSHNPPHPESGLSLMELMHK